MRHRLTLLFLSIALPTAAVAVAPAATGTDLPKWAAKAESALKGGRGAEARAIIDKQLKVVTDPGERAAMLVIRLVADAELGDRRSFRSDAAQAIAISTYPETVLPKIAELSVGYDPETSISAIARLAQVDPNAARAIDSSLIMQLYNRLRDDKLDVERKTFTLLLADISYGNSLLRDGFQLEAAELLIERGQTVKALNHVVQIRGRNALNNVLTDRRYQQFWPELERTVGDRMETAARANLAFAEAAFQADPNDLRARRALMQADSELGLYDAADALARDFGRDRASLMSMDKNSMWVVELHASILAYAGRFDEAEKRRAAVVDTWTEQRSWVVNTAINRISSLINARRFGEALTLLDKDRGRLKKSSSSYAKQLLRSYRISALVGLNRRDEALRQASELPSHADDAPIATIASLILVNRDAEAERLVIEQLKRPDRRKEMISYLSVGDVWSKYDPNVQSGDARFRARPAVEAAFQAVARDIPQRLRRTF